MASPAWKDVAAADEATRAVIVSECHGLSPLEYARKLAAENPDDPERQKMVDLLEEHLKMATRFPTKRKIESISLKVSMAREKSEIDSDTKFEISSNLKKIERLTAKRDALPNLVRLRVDGLGCYICLFLPVVGTAIHSCCPGCKRICDDCMAKHEKCPSCGQNLKQKAVRDCIAERLVVELPLPSN